MPMARNIPISFYCSYKLALIDALRLKKLRNIIIAMATMKIRSRIERISSVDSSSTYLMVGGTPVYNIIFKAIWSIRA